MLKQITVYAENKKGTMKDITGILASHNINIWGSVTVNDRGQIVIPKGARDHFDLTAGMRLIVLSDESGIALIPEEAFKEIIERGMEWAAKAHEGK